jgi:hypothetical protein
MAEALALTNDQLCDISILSTMNCSSTIQRCGSHFPAMDMAREAQKLSSAVGRMLAYLRDSQRLGAVVKLV